jgi:hypothetical protein
MSEITLGDPIDIGYIDLDLGFYERKVDIGPAVGLPTLVLGNPVSIPVLTVREDGTFVWVGEGEPTIVPGAAPGNLYLDDLSGTLYRLD